jgi:hypothetical protein
MDRVRGRRRCLTSELCAWTQHSHLRPTLGPAPVARGLAPAVAMSRPTQISRVRRVARVALVARRVERRRAIPFQLIVRPHF